MTSLSLEDFEQDPVFRRLFALKMVATYPDFSDLIIEAIGEIYETDLSPNKHLYYESSEDQLTAHIASCLKCMGFDAEHGRVHGGNTDLKVEKRSGTQTFVWLAEAKINNNYTHLYEGMLQLATRYMTPQATYNNRGALLVYIQKTNMPFPEIMEIWKVRLQEQSTDPEKPITGLRLEDVCKYTKKFLSRHTHVLSGFDVETLHIPMDIRHIPKDKSARNAKS